MDRTIDTRPYYHAYAGMYGSGSAPDGVRWDTEGESTYTRWQSCGQDRAEAARCLARYQQEGFDFCGIGVSQAS